MMINPDGYYEMNLKGKNAKQILSAIRGLKNEIGHLKNIMEHPDYGAEIIMHPSEEVRLWCTRLYLDRAKEALAETGETYTPSQAELKAKAFDDSVPHITKVIFSIGGYCSGYETYTVDLTDDHLQMNTEHSYIPKPSNFGIVKDYPMGKKEFLDRFYDLHIGEWRANYNLERFGIHVCDGTQWDLEIYFSNEHKPIKIYGDNAYPYNFNKLQELFGIDTDYGDDSEW